MAQNYVGSNNINLLLPLGQFGSRAMGGKDHASARYIFTKLNPITRMIFREEDDDIVDYQNDDGDMVEPLFYLPIIPMVLVNGSEGIGTGWSSYIPNYNPREIVENLKRKLNGDEFQPMVPYYKNFTGQITKNSTGFDCKGKYEVHLFKSQIEILELPVSSWTSNYKKFLEEEILKQKDKEGLINDFKEYHKTDTVHF